MKHRSPLLFFIIVAGMVLIRALAPLPATDTVELRGGSDARGTGANVGPGSRKSATGDPGSSSTEAPAKVIGLERDAWRPPSLQLSEVMTNERALEAVSALEPKVAMVVTKRFLGSVVQQGGDTAGGPERDVLCAALAKGHVVFGVDCIPEDLSGALGLQDAVTPWDPEGSYFPMEGFLDPGSVSPGVAVWFDEGWHSYRVREPRQPTRRSKDRVGTRHVVDPNSPSYDFVAPMLASILRQLNADGASKATAAP